jgi:hypothetical protein
MSRCSEEALEAALEELSEHARSSRARSNWISTYLVAQRMTAAGYPMAVAGANSAVSDLFILLADHVRGRSNPFVDLDSEYRWGQVKDSGRKTAWNTGTRNGAQTILFNEEHFKNGLKSDAIDILLQQLGGEEPLPGGDALAVFLTRDNDWVAPPTRDQLHAAACAILGLSRADFGRITSDTQLKVPIIGSPEWSPNLLEATQLGPHVAVTGAGLAEPIAELPIESTHELVDRFRKFLGSHGIAVGGRDELIDLLAAALSSQLVIMAGPSGSGKSLMAAALGAFFAPESRRCRLEASRLLAKPEEFLGYYSHLAGERFVATDQLLALLEVDTAPTTPPMITIEEANLSPVEGYFSSLVHGLGNLETAMLSLRLHSQPAAVSSQVPDQKVPPIFELKPYPRFFATINVDADSPAPARKVVSRACVVLLETPTFETALAAADTIVHPSIERAEGPAAALIGKPSAAFGRYVATGSNSYQQALGERAALLRNALGVDVIAHRQLQRCLLYMAWFVELSGEADAEQGSAAVEAAADNALLHFVLPSLPAAQFERTIEALDAGERIGVLAIRLAHLCRAISDHQFGPPPDFWGALS